MCKICVTWIKCLQNVKRLAFVLEFSFNYFNVFCRIFSFLEFVGHFSSFFWVNSYYVTTKKGGIAKGCMDSISSRWQIVKWLLPKHFKICVLSQFEFCQNLSFSHNLSLVTILVVTILVFTVFFTFGVLSILEFCHKLSFVAL